MGTKVEKRFDRLELADYLADLSQQLRRGRFEAEGRIWTVPAEVDAKIHFKEEEGLLVTKISWHWSALGGYIPESEGTAPREHTSFKDVKTRMRNGFKELQRLIMAGVFPDEKVMRDFVEDSRSFAEFVKPEWQKPLAEYMMHLENLQGAVENRQLEAMQNELQALVNCMIECHREFKK